MLLNPREWSFHDATLHRIDHDQSHRHLCLEIEINLGLQHRPDPTDAFYVSRLRFEDTRLVTSDPAIPLLDWDDANQTGRYGDILSLEWRDSGQVVMRFLVDQEYYELMIECGAVEWEIFDHGPYNDLG